MRRTLRTRYKSVNYCEVSPANTAKAPAEKTIKTTIKTAKKTANTTKMPKLSPQEQWISFAKSGKLSIGEKFNAAVNILVHEDINPIVLVTMPEQFDLDVLEKLGICTIVAKMLIGRYGHHSLH